MRKLLLFLACLVLGCGSDISSFQSGPNGTATIRVVNSAGRVLPGQVDTIKLAGFDETGQLRHEPDPRAKAEVLDFESVPLEVRSISIEIRHGNQVLGIASATVQLRPGEVTEVRDPAYASPLNLLPKKARSAQNGQRQYRLLNTASNGAIVDVTSQAQWQSSDPVVTITGGLATIGSTSTVKDVTITSTWEGLQQTSALHIVPQRFLFAVNSSENTVVTKTFNSISNFVLNADGTLSSLGAKVATGLFPISLTIHPNGYFAYTTNSLEDTIGVYSISDAGALTLVSTHPAGSFPQDLLVEPTGRFSYHTADDGVDISSIGEDGLLTRLRSVPSGGVAFWLAMDRVGQFLLTANFWGGPDATFFFIQPQGGLTRLTNLTVPGAVGGVNPVAVALNPAGTMAYAVGPNLAAYTIKPLPVLSGQAPAGTLPTSVVVEPQGRFVYVGNGGSNDISMFKADLTPLGKVACPGSPQGLTFDATGRFLYATAFDDGVIRAYTLQPDGTLNPLGSWAAEGCCTTTAITP